MEVKPGYKQTDVGVIPKEWSSCLLGTEIKEMTDFVAAGSFESLRSNVQVYDTPHFAVYVRLYDLRLGLGHSGQKYVDETSYKFLSKSNLYGNEILVANIGANVGEVFLMPSGVGPATIAPNMIVLRADDRRVRSGYLYYYITSDYGQARIKELIAGSGHPKINKTDLKQLKVVAPPLAEQETITGALSDADGLIESLEQLLAKNRQLKQGVMQELLTGKTRLPGFQTKPGYQQTEIGVIPEDWRVSTLGNTCAFENGDRGRNYPSEASFAASGVPFVNAGHVTEGRITLSELSYISKESFDLLGSGKFMPGDILFCLRGSLGKFGVVGSDLGEGAIASSLVIVRPKSAIVSGEYLSCYFRSSYCAQMIDKWSGGAAQPNLGAQDLARFIIPLPPTKGEQDSIANILSDMDAEIAASEGKLTKARQLKQGMMQELLTGRIRLV